MASEVFQLALLLSLKDGASSGLDRFAGKLRSLGKDGQIGLDQLEKIRADLNRDLSIGGVGIGILAGLKNGVDAAGEYEDAIFELRRAFQELPETSGRSLAVQEQDFKKLTALATDLGNQLQGSSRDYLTLFTSLNKAGIDANATLNGTGKAVAYLANVTGAIRNGTGDQLAEDFGSFAKMFAVSGEKDLMKMVNLFAAIDDKFNLQSSNLIESSKYFFSTAKSALNLTGAEGATETAKLMAFMKRFTAREGSVAGTSLDNLIGQYLSHKEKLEALEKEKGISIDFFDDKGQFKGNSPEERVKTLFTELQKLQTLNPKERATWLKDIFGEVGYEAADAISAQGLKGWQEINNEIAKSVPVQKQINQQMETYNAKTEALSGSWQNFKASAFTPLMEDAKKFVDLGSSIANGLQKFSAEHTRLTSTLTTFAAYGSTAMVVYSGFKLLTTGVRLFRLMSAFSRAEGLIPYLTQTKIASDAAGASITATTAKASGLRGALQSQTVKIGVQIAAVMGIEYLIGVIQSEIQKAFDAGKMQNDISTQSNSNVEIRKKAEAEGVTFTQKDFEGSASTAWYTALHSGLDFATGGKEWQNLPFLQKFSYGAKQSYLYPISKWADAENKFTGYGSNRDKNTIATGFKTFNPELQDSRIMAEFLKQLPQRIPDENNQKLVREGLQTAFPESFSAAIKSLSELNLAPMTQSFAELSLQIKNQSLSAEQVNQQTQTLSQNLSNLQQPMTNLGDSAQKVPTPLNNIVNSANSVSSSLNSVSQKMADWNPPTPQFQTYQVPVANGTAIPPVVLPSRAIGGVVEKDGLAMVHAGNVINPAKVTKGVSGKSSAPTIVYSPTINLSGDAASAKEDFRAMLYEHTKDLERILADKLNIGRIRS